MGFQEDNRLRVRKKHVDEVKKMLRDNLNEQAWSYLLDCGVLEYIDCEEEETSMVAMFPKDLARKAG